MAHKFPWQSPYSAFNNSPILYNDPTGKSGEVSISGNVITVTATMVFYGTKSSPELAVATAAQVEKQWNAANGTVEIGDTKYEVRFVITGVYRPDLTAKEVAQNTDIKNNYIRVDDNTPAGVSLTYGSDGSNSGWYKYDEIAGDGETTASHEMGHGWNILTDGQEPGHNDYSDGSPDIMVGRGAIVNGAYSRNPGPQSGELNPDKRVVTPDNILALGIQNLEFKNNMAQLGVLINKFFTVQPAATDKPKPDGQK